MMNNSSLNKPRRRSASRSRMFRANFSRSKWVLVMLTMAWPLCLAGRRRDFTTDEINYEEVINIRCQNSCGTQIAQYDYMVIRNIIKEGWTYYVEEGEEPEDAKWWCNDDHYHLCQQAYDAYVNDNDDKIQEANKVHTMTLKQKKQHFCKTVRNNAQNRPGWPESKLYLNYSLEDMENHKCACGNYQNPAIRKEDCGSQQPFWRISDTAYEQAMACSFGMKDCKALSLIERKDRATVKWRMEGKRVLSRWKLEDGKICADIDAKTAIIEKEKLLKYKLKFDNGIVQYIDKDDFKRDYLIYFLDGKDEAKIIRKYFKRVQKEDKRKKQRLKRKPKEGKRNKPRRLFTRSTPRRRFF